MNHEITVTCPHCGCEYDARLHWYVCPQCGFEIPTDYVLVGNQSEQKKYIGNAVEVNMARQLCEALAEKN